MAWLMIILSLIVLWVASLFKILQNSYSHSKSTFLNHAGGPVHQRNLLLVIAHPDDESMFFTPTINYLTSRGHNLHILCLSTGNADGKGNIRKFELYQASAILKIPPNQVKILDHQDLQDGFGKVWSPSLIANIIEKEIQTYNIDVIVTFDNYGVSGHCNHRDVNQGVRNLLYGASQINVEAWELVSTNILRKYIGPVDVWFSMLNTFCYPKGELHCLLNEQSSITYTAMAQHRSQWVWFRKLFVSFSSYTYVNTVRMMEK